MNLGKILRGTVVRGHRVASGLAADCPWPGGSVRRQLPLMAQHGMDVSNLYPGTINVALQVETIPWPDTAEFDFLIDWRSPEAPTPFRFHRLSMGFADKWYAGWSYRKMYPLNYVSRHPHPANVIEVLAPHIQDMGYGSHVMLAFGDEPISE